MKIVAEADYHSGHLAGLTPPAYWNSSGPWKAVQQELWRTRQSIIQKVGRPDLLILDGDLIDGRGGKSGGTELITSALIVQARMAAECAVAWEAPKVAIARGTDYHTNWGGEEWEDLIAESIENKLRQIHGNDFQVEIGDQLFLNADGVTFDVKHKTGSASTPYTGGTGILKDKMWNEQWYLNGEGQPLADVVLRAHIHIHQGIWGIRAGRQWYAIRLPALQASSRYGTKQVAHTIDWGLVVFEVEAGKILDVQSHIVAIKANKAVAIKM